MNKTFQTIRAAVLTTAFLAVSSTAAFGQPQAPAAADISDAVKNAVGFNFGCNTTGCFNGGFAIPRGHRLVITQVSVNANVQLPTLFVLVGTLNGLPFPHSFPAATRVEAGYPFAGTYHCFIVVDSLQMGDSKMGLGAGTVHISGYLVKM